MNGTIDEVRISNVARSAAWIKASYNSENNTLLSVGVEQTQPNRPDNLLVENQASPQHLTTFTPTFSFRYTDNDGDNENAIHIQVGTSASDNSLWDNQQVKIAENNSTISVVYAGSALSRGATYWWRVMVQDNTGLWGNWSGNENFMIDNTPPNKPTNLLPSTRQTTENVAISAFVSDNYWTANGSKLDVFFYDNATKTLIDNIWADNGGTASVVWHNLVRGTTYTFFARAQDNTGTWGENSDTQSFKINQLPTTPTISTSPSTIYVGTSWSATGSGSTDADGDSITYYYRFYNVTDGIERQAYSTNNSYTISTGDAHDTIRVYVKAYDGYEYSGEFENSVIVANTSPNIPTNLGPSETQTTADVTIYATVTDNDNDMVNVFFYDNATGNVIDNVWINSGENTQVVWSGLARGNTYTFFARAYDGTDWSENSDTQTFWLSNNININGNAGFTPENGVNGGGSGTESDPYIIENWAIDASGADGIKIQNTTAYFVVRNCLVENSGSHNGISLNKVVHGRIENVVLDNIGVLLDDYYAISVAYSGWIDIVGCTFRNVYGYHAIVVFGYDYSSNENVREILIDNCRFENIFDEVLFCQYVSNVTFANSTAENVGLAVDFAGGIRFDGNTGYGLVENILAENNIITTSLANNIYGIHFGVATGTIDNNTIMNLSGKGIWVESDHNNLTNNTCENNAYGIYLTSSSNSNTIFLNYLLNNRDNNAYDGGTNNYWDNNGMGNYWGDWQPPEHPDVNADNIIDEPRLIAGSAGSRDNYPLRLIFTKPNKPTNLQPSTRQTTTNVIISCVGTDNDGDNINIHFYDNSDKSLIDNVWIENGQTASVEWAGLTRGNTYTFFARVYDGTDWSENSDTQTFWLNQLPSVPVLSAPENGAATNDNTPTFEFSAIDNDGDNLRYKLELSNDGFATVYKTFDQTENQAGWSAENYASGATASFTIQVENALPDNLYQWRSYAYDGFEWSSASTVRASTVDTLAPAAPTLHTPDNNSTVTIATPTFGWENVVDNSGVTYRLVIANDLDFLSPIYDKSGIPQNQHAIENALSNENYYWRVRAVDGAANVSDWSDNFKLTIQTVLPPPPSPPAPPPPIVPSFRIAVSPESGSVQQGSVTTATVSLTALEGYSSVVTLSASQLSGISVSFSPSSGVPDFTSTMTVIVSSAPVGSHWIYLEAVGADGTRQSVGYSLSVTAAWENIEVIEENENGEFDFGNYLPVDTIGISAVRRIENVAVSVEVLPDRPADAPQLTLRAYFYLNITTTASGADIGGVIIRFKVLRSWVEQNNIDESTIKLLKLNGVWRELPTRTTGGDANYLYLEATGTGFSLFAIAGEQHAVLPPPPVLFPPFALLISSALISLGGLGGGIAVYIRFFRPITPRISLKRLKQVRPFLIRHFKLPAIVPAVPIANLIPAPITLAPAAPVGRFRPVPITTPVPVPRRKAVPLPREPTEVLKHLKRPSKHVEPGVSLKRLERKISERFEPMIALDHLKQAAEPLEPAIFLESLKSAGSLRMPAAIPKRLKERVKYIRPHISLTRLRLAEWGKPVLRAPAKPAERIEPGISIQMLKKRILGA